MTFADNGSWVLGAPENVMTAGYAGELQASVEEHAHQGQRVLILAKAEGSFSDGADATLPAVTPTALVLLEDIVRADAPATLKYFADEGVIVKVISGDNNVTVGAVARRAGLVGWENNIDATTMPPDGDEAFIVAVEASTVFGRVTPHQKRSMVLALQSRGHTVAMTGDGVNDVLALKDANCGVAMASGSEATQLKTKSMLRQAAATAARSVMSSLTNSALAGRSLESSMSTTRTAWPASVSRRTMNPPR